MNSRDEPLGRLEKVQIEDVWVHEASNFTPWLAKPENLELLGEALGIVLELEGVEVAVGPYSADIRCKDASDGSWVVIENQLRRTDHSHLGQILTYAAGLDAHVLVWIASQFTEEHRASLDWLNEHTNEDISFFGVEIELWRIGNSMPAPKFNLVSKPNDWTKSVKKVAQEGNSQSSEVARRRLEFWTAFRDYLDEHSQLRGGKPSVDHWMNFPVGVSGSNLAAIASTFNSRSNSYKPELRAELAVTSKDAKRWFLFLKTKEATLNSSLDSELVWHNPDNAQLVKFYVQRDCDFRNSTQWPEQFAWLERNLILLREAFGPILRRGLPSEFTSNGVE